MNLEAQETNLNSQNKLIKIDVKRINYIQNPSKTNLQMIDKTKKGEVDL